MTKNMNPSQNSCMIDIPPSRWPKPDPNLPPRDPKIDEIICDLWYTMHCPPDLAAEIAAYIKRPYPKHAAHV